MVILLRENDSKLKELTIKSSLKPQLTDFHFSEINYDFF